ncbi:MAG: hypothetical protein WD042_19810 [Phycisphaeraceae bacterium]
MKALTYLGIILLALGLFLLGVRLFYMEVAWTFVLIGLIGGGILTVLGVALGKKS